MKMYHQNGRLSFSSSSEPRDASVTFCRLLFAGIFLSVVLKQATLFVRYSSAYHGRREMYFEELMEAPTIRNIRSGVESARSPASESVKKGTAVVSGFSDSLESQTTTGKSSNNDNNDEIAPAATNALDDESNPNETREIEILLPPEEIAWMKERIHKFGAWHNSSLIDPQSIRKMRIAHNTMVYKTGADMIGGNDDDDDNRTVTTGGPWLDFMIIGAPKCGTTSLVANLAAIAPMTTADHCKDPPMTLLHAYNDWPLELNPFGNRTLRAAVTTTTTAYDHSNGDGAIAVEQIPLPFRGFKCPAFLGSNSYLYLTGRSLTKTKIIVGIRHPILWFQSFWRMQGRDDPYERMGICPCRPNPKFYGRAWKCRNPYHVDVDATNTTITATTVDTAGAFVDNNISNANATTTTVAGAVNPMVSCRNECGGALLCTARGRFHLGLAKLGKTALTNDELSWLAPGDPDGGEHIRNVVRHKPIKNTVFFYEQTQLKDDPHFWDGLGNFLGVSHLPNNAYVGSKGRNKEGNDLCDPYYDYFRATMMASSYELAVWLQTYFLPEARDPNRTDLVVANDNVDLLETIVEGYKADPCGRLVRDPASGNYVLDPVVIAATATNAATDPDFIETTGSDAKASSSSAAAPLAPLPPPEYRTIKKYSFLGGKHPNKSDASKKPTPQQRKQEKKRRGQRKNA